MIRFIQEAAQTALPKLSQTSLYMKFDQASNVTAALREELATASENIQKPDDLKETVALMRLKGEGVINKAIDAWERGEIVVLFNNETSKLPSALPYICIGKEGSIKCYIFADKLVTKLNSTNEYINLLAGLEAGYLAICLQKNPDRFVNNRNIMLLFANIYQSIVTTPLEAKIYMKSENLKKAMVYAIAFFYKIIDGPSMSMENINFKRLMRDQLDLNVTKQIVEEVRSLPSASFMDLLELIKKINPVRYKQLDAEYLRHFVSACGVYITFALENPAYLFLAITSSFRRTSLTSFNLNTSLGTYSKECIKQLVSLV